MTTYLAFLRGVNVGGNGLISMAELKDALSAAGLSKVHTYIQSGNVIFDSAATSNPALVELVASVIEKTFALTVAVAVFSLAEWRQIITAAPAWWGQDDGWKHNLLIMIEPYDMADTVTAIGELKPGWEHLKAGKRVLYQSVDKQYIGRTRTGSKLASSSVYKRMTIRNYNTATKLLALMWYCDIM